MLIECSVAPSGGASWPRAIQGALARKPLNPATPSQFSPPSSLTKSPCGLVPAYQRPGWRAEPGVSQNTRSTESPAPSAALANWGGRAASFQLAPPSVERNTVGPRWPAFTAATSVRPSRGSTSAWFTTSPRKWGPSKRQRRRPRSAERTNSPLRVPTRTARRRIVLADRQSFLMKDLSEPSRPPFFSSCAGGSGSLWITYLGSCFLWGGIVPVAGLATSTERLTRSAQLFGRPMKYLANSSTAFSLNSCASSMNRSTSSAPTFLVTILILPVSWSPSILACTRNSQLILKTSCVITLRWSRNCSLLCSMFDCHRMSRNFSISSGPFLTVSTFSDQLR